MTKIKLLPFHKRLTDLFPAMTEQEFNDLVGDINIHGQRNPVDIWNGEIIDGEHRALACQRLEIEPRYQERRFKDEAGARAYVISLNMARRHLTPEQKRKLIAELLKADPTQSDNSIAKQAKTTNKTVAAQRKKLEGRKEIPNVSKRTDAKGRKQPAKKATKKSGSPAKAEPKVEPTTIDVDNNECSRQQLWECSLQLSTNGAITLEACWTDNYGEAWRSFPVSSEFATLARRAADAWRSLAEQLEARVAPAAAATAATEPRPTSQTAAAADTYADGWPVMPECVRRVPIADEQAVA
jgi:hypothetical protein